jgi:hypothetical protein
MPKKECRKTAGNSGLLQWLGLGFIWKILCLIKIYFYICNGQCQINATESKPRNVGGKLMKLNAEIELI